MRKRKHVKNTQIIPTKLFSSSFYSSTEHEHPGHLEHLEHLERLHVVLIVGSYKRQVSKELPKGQRERISNVKCKKEKEKRKKKENSRNCSTSKANKHHHSPSRDKTHTINNISHRDIKVVLRKEAVCGVEWTIVLDPVHPCLLRVNLVKFLGGDGRGVQSDDVERG